MIINLILGLFFQIASILFVFFPVVTLSDIPFIGTTLSSGLLSFIMMWNAFMETFPYAQTAWQIVLIVIIPFEILLLVGKVFFGNRLPVNH